MNRWSGVNRMIDTIRPLNYRVILDGNYSIWVNLPRTAGDKIKATSESKVDLGVRR